MVRQCTPSVEGTTMSAITSDDEMSTSWIQMQVCTNAYKETSDLAV